MNPWIIIAALWLPLSALAALTIGRWMRGPHAPVPPPFASPSGGGAGQCPVPGQQALPGPAHGRPPRPAPAPARTPHEHAALARYAALTTTAILPGHVHAGREIADGLRQRFPGTDDTTLGIIAMDLRGYATALDVGLPDPAQAMQALIDCLAIAAEDLTRLDRTQGVYPDGF